MAAGAVRGAAYAPEARTHRASWLGGTTALDEDAAPARAARLRRGAPYAAAAAEGIEKLQVHTRGPAVAAQIPTWLVGGRPREPAHQADGLRVALAGLLVP